MYVEGDRVRILNGTNAGRVGYVDEVIPSLRGEDLRVELDEDRSGAWVSTVVDAESVECLPSP